MSYVDRVAQELHLKVVYYGPGLAGKTTNIQHVFRRADPARRGRIESLATEEDRVLTFDFLSASFAAPGGLAVRVHLVTVPGPVFYDVSRRQALDGADSVIFVADSQEERREANLEFFEEMTASLEVHRRDPKRVPVVFQYNKRDLPNAAPVAALDGDLAPGARPRFEAIAHQGVGVFDTLQACVQLALAGLSTPYR